MEFYSGINTTVYAINAMLKISNDIFLRFGIFVFLRTRSMTKPLSFRKTGISAKLDYANLRNRRWFGVCLTFFESINLCRDCGDELRSAA